MSANSTSADAERVYPPKNCEPCAGWNEPIEPFRIFGDTYYVGTAGLASILIHSPQGAILLDGGLPQSAPLILASIEKLRFRERDVKILVNTHAHYDHAGGLAQLQHVTGAPVYASPPSKLAFERGDILKNDPQTAFGTPHNSFPAIRDVRALEDGQTLTVGPLAITAHFTPGHTPGGTSWTWRSCEGAQCVNIVYADSLNSVSAPGFKFTGDATHRSRVTSFEKSIQTVANLPCDLLLAPHPELIDMSAKLEKLKSSPAVNPFIDPAACRNYAAAAKQRLDKRVLEERASGAPAP
ncbi:MAG: subclass B3 metallo-beta-lactamase [Steroidobacteraceae bacterium]|nr:subclass B3 metallo-beta-lactamase [Steroidobacteraceae bacterium]